MEEFDLGDLKPIKDDSKKAIPLPLTDTHKFEWEKEYGGWTQEKAVGYYEEQLKTLIETPEEIKPIKDRTKKCLCCGRYFYPARGFYDVTHFCSGRCKQKTYRENKALFRELPIVDYSGLTMDAALAQLMEEDPCYYCGLIADTIDHTVPQWLIKKTFDMNEFIHIPGIKNLLVRACGECNSTISGKVFNSLTDRRKYVQQQYKKKYRKLLSIPSWEEEELEELSGRMQQSVRASIAQKKVVLYRLKWPDV